MSVFTVHEPPLRYADTTADPQRFVFVRDGFYVWAFLLAPLWMIRHRLWLVLFLYVVILLAVDIGLRLLGASSFLISLTAILIALLVGLEGATLRRFTLRRRGWRNVGVVSGNKIEDAELRFFDAWTRRAPRVKAPAGQPGYAPPSSPQASDPSGVIGLFPEPGASR
jgi:hypothetical protein